MQGLSGRESMATGEGMLFIFPTLTTRSMWMPEMRFAIDVVWLDEYLNVTGVSPALQPCASRQACPSTPSPGAIKYAIEMAAGQAAALGLRSGARVTLV